MDQSVPLGKEQGMGHVLHPRGTEPRRPGEREGAAQLALVQYMAWYT